MKCQLRLLGLGVVCLIMVAVVPGVLAGPPTPPDQRSPSAVVPETAALIQDEALPEAPLNPYTPPACAGIFTDVACPGGFAVNWIEQFYADGITAGCGTSPLRYCPSTPVTRDQMAVFVEKAMRGTLTWSPGALAGISTGVGDGSLYNNSPFALYNTAIGHNALFQQSFANGNVSYFAENTAVGDSALVNNQPDGGNSNLNGTGNTAVGWAALFNNTNGYRNVALGRSAGITNTQGFWNTFVGADADVDNYGRVNATAIGYGAIVNSSYMVRIGNTDVSQIGGQVGWTAFSDIRGKKDVVDLDLGLDFVMALRPVSYRLKNGNDRIDMGFVAQDIEALLGDDYNVLAIGGDKDRTLALRHTDLIAPMVKAIQELQTQIESRDARIAALEARLAAIEERLAGK